MAIRNAIRAAAVAAAAGTAAVAGTGTSAAHVPPMAVSTNYTVGEAQNCVIDYRAWIDINPRQRGKVVAWVQALDMWGIGQECNTPIRVGWINGQGKNGVVNTYLRARPTATAPVRVELNTGPGRDTIISFASPALAPFQGQAPYIKIDL